MTDTLPIVNDRLEEEFLRKSYTGKYLYAMDDLTGEVLKKPVERSTRLEYPDPIPVEIPVQLKRPESTDDKIRRLMNEQRAWEAWQSRGDENDDDESDFSEAYEDPDTPASPYEFTDAAMRSIRRRERIERYKEERAKNAKEGKGREPRVSDAPPPSDEAEPPAPKAGAAEPKKASKAPPDPKE